MKILQCIHAINCGGTQRQLHYLTSGLIKKGHEVHIAYFRGDFYFQKLTNSGATLHQIRTIGNIFHRIPPRYYFCDLTIPLQLYSLINRLKPDIIQTWYREMDIPVGLIAVRKKIPWVLREANSYRSWSNHPSDLIRKYIGKKASAIVSNSLSGNNYWERACFKKNKCIIRNALPYVQIRQTNNILLNFGPNSNENFILYAGRLAEKDKNIHNLFEAIVKYIIYNNIKVVLCGDGLYKNQIIKKVAKYGIGRKVIMPGFVEDQSLWTLMKSAKLFVLVSNVEGCPNAVLEAMACGCPLVVSDIPEHREFLNEDIAWFVNPNSPQDIAEGISKVLDNPDMARKKAQLAQKKAKNWQSITKMTDEYMTIYDAILEVSKN